MVRMNFDAMRRWKEAGFDFAAHYEWRGKTLEGGKLSPKLVGYTCQDIVKSVFQRAGNHIQTTVEKLQLRLEQEYRRTLDRRMACRFFYGGVGETGRWQRKHLFSFPAFWVHRRQQVAGEYLNREEGMNEQ